MRKVLLSLNICSFVDQKEFQGLQIILWENELFTRLLASVLFIFSKKKNNEESAALTYTYRPHLKKFSTASN